MNRLLPIFISAALIGVIMAGCSSTPKGTTPMSHTYGSDGYLGLSNSNPNFRMNATHHHYTDDVDLMTNALAEFGLSNRSRIWINGATAHVQLNLPRKLPQAELQRLKTDVYTQLRSWVPRYQFVVTTNVDTNAEGRR